ncbi:tyrosine-type recombinase/integrase [Vibrio splendidus]
MESVKFRLATGETSYALYVDGEPVVAFNCYMNDLARSSTFNTVKNKASDLKTFFGYLDALNDPDAIAELNIGVEAGTPLLTEMILQFPHYLAKGEKAKKDSLAELAARTTYRKPTSTGTNQRIISTVRGFLIASAELQAELQSASELDLIDLSIAPEIMFSESLFRQSMPLSQRKSLLKKSVIAGVCRHGARLSNPTILKSVRGAYTPAAEGSAIKKALPHSDAIAVLNATKTHRDRLYLSLLMGTGMREIEAANVLMQDIDVRNKTVKCVNPKSRPLAYGNSFELFSGQTIQDSAYKGRATDETLFVEPFRSIFFQTLRDYLVLERKPLGVGHKYLFVVLRKGEYLGRPLAMSSDKTRQYALKQCLKDVYGKRGLPTPRRLALHSLRHLYGVHCLNYLLVGFDDNEKPIYGLHESVVQRLMGHENISSTRIYAVPDVTRVLDKVERALNYLQNEAIQQDQLLVLNNHFGADL